MKRTINDFKKYIPYAYESAKSELKAQVSDSHLGWLWWILDPLLFMLIYSFVVKTIFGASIDNFPIFVFIGLTIWNFFSATLQNATGIVRSYRAIITKVYIPKYILVCIVLMVNFIKMAISFGLVFLFLICLDINITIHILQIIPLLLSLIIITFFFSLIFLHIGVFISDLSNVVTVLLRLMFYLSGVFYSMDRLPKALFSFIEFLNPIAFFINQFRNSLMYNNSINSIVLFYWTGIGIIGSYRAIKIIYKYENSYVKVI